MTFNPPIKPLGIKAYGSIPHLPGSRRGSGDHGLEESQADILLSKSRLGDEIIVTEKLDGSCVSIANIDGAITPLIRAGYYAETSNYAQHHVFHRWVMKQADRFRELINPGERCVGEWLYVAHGTIYHLQHEPFVIFDIFDYTNKRLPYDECVARCAQIGAITPQLIYRGKSIGIPQVLSLLGTYGYHGAQDPCEGAVWRCETKGKFNFLGKYVAHEKQDGKYLQHDTYNKLYTELF